MSVVFFDVLALALRNTDVTSMNFMELSQLYHLNDMVVTHFIKNINNVDELCNFDTHSMLTKIKTTLPPEELQTDLLVLQEKLNQLHDLITTTAFTHSTPVATPQSSAWQTALTSSAFATTFVVLCYIGGFKRAVAYTLFPLYLLRGKSYEDVAKGYPSLLWLKKIIGSTERVYTWKYDSNDDLGALLKRKKEQEKKYGISIKIEKIDNSDYGAFNFLKNYSFSVSDGSLFKLSVHALLFKQLIEDFNCIAKCVDAKFEHVHTYMAQRFSYS